MGHEVLRPGGEAFDAVVGRWPEAAPDGVVDRGILAGIVFENPTELAILEAITHPSIRRRLRTRIKELGSQPVVCEVSVPRLLQGEAWPVIVVVAPLTVRRERLRRRGLSDSEISARFAAQPSQTEWSQLGNVIIDNGGDLVSLEVQVDGLARGIIRGWKQGPQNPDPTGSS